MPDLGLPEAVSGRPPTHTAKRQRSEANLNIVFDHDGRDSIDSRPLPGLLVSRGTETTSTAITTEPETQIADDGFAYAINEGKASRSWHSKEWNSDMFDADNKNMSIAVVTKLASRLSLLKNFLDHYIRFNAILGDIVSGPRHQGHLDLVFSTVAHLESLTSRLRFLRNEKQRGNPTPGTMELVAQKISHTCRARRDYLWDVMLEKVDMINDVAREKWLKKKTTVLKNVIEWMVISLKDLGPEEEWREKEVREVRELRESCERKWKKYAAMDQEDLKAAGLILEVGN